MMIFTIQEYLVIAALSPFIELADLSILEAQIAKWIKSEEPNYFIKIIEKSKKNQLDFLIFKYLY